MRVERPRRRDVEALQRARGREEPAPGALQRQRQLQGLGPRPPTSHAGPRAGRMSHCECSGRAVEASLAALFAHVAGHILWWPHSLLHVFSILRLLYGWGGILTSWLM